MSKWSNINADSGEKTWLTPKHIITDAWQSLVFPFAHSILFLKGRIRFCRADGTDGDCATAPSALIAYSPADTDALAKSGLEGANQ